MASREVWFVVHGYRQLAERFIRRFEALPGVGQDRAVVAPEALSRFYIEEEVGPHGSESRVGASWMTRADRDHEILDYVEYLDRLAAAVLSAGGGAPVESGIRGTAPVGGSAAEPLDAGGRRVVVLGFSQGAETASRWAAYGRIRPDELILWGGGLAVDLDRERAAESLKRLRVRLVVGSEDRWGDRRSAESEGRLRELGLEPERMEYSGGHVIRPEVLREHWR